VGVSLCPLIPTAEGREGSQERRQGREGEGQEESQARKEGKEAWKEGN